MPAHGGFSPSGSKAAGIVMTFIGGAILIGTLAAFGAASIQNPVTQQCVPGYTGRTICESVGGGVDISSFIVPWIAAVIILGLGVASLRSGIHQQKLVNQCSRIAYQMRGGTVDQLSMAFQQELSMKKKEIDRDYIPYLGRKHIIGISGNQWKSLDNIPPS
jgi:hypothetical protein